MCNCSGAPPALCIWFTLAGKSLFIILQVSNCAADVMLPHTSWRWPICDYGTLFLGYLRISVWVIKCLDCRGHILSLDDMKLYNEAVTLLQAKSATLWNNWEGEGRVNRIGAMRRQLLLPNRNPSRSESLPSKAPRQKESVPYWHFKQQQHWESRPEKKNVYIYPNLKSSITQIELWGSYHLRSWKWKSPTPSPFEVAQFLAWVPVVEFLSRPESWVLIQATLSRPTHFLLSGAGDPPIGARVTLIMIG